MKKVQVPRPGAGFLVAGLLGVFVGAATVALVRRLVFGGRSRNRNQPD